jgi:ABC-type antimicrobial peptide transport system permease subunit
LPRGSDLGLEGAVLDVAVNLAEAQDIIAGTLNHERLGMTLMLIFCGFAIILAAIGIYGVITYAAMQRRLEFATRMAFGASSAHVFAVVLTSNLRLAATGIALGIACGYSAGRVISGNVYAMRASDPLILAVAAATVAIVTIVTTLIPAVSASRLDPAQTLRSE